MDQTNLSAPKTRKILCLFYSLWIVHGILKAFLLERANAMGLPFVSKFDWYFPHALAIDFHWLMISFIPLFMVGYLWPHQQSMVLKTFWWATCIFQGILLILTVIDHEVHRAFGSHVSFNFLHLYFNVSSIREMFMILGQDQATSFLPYLLFFLCIPAWYFLYLLITKLKIPVKAFWICLIVLGLSFWIYRKAWSGGFREKKLMPVVKIFWKEFQSRKAPALSPQVFNQSSQLFQTMWLNMQGDSTWIFSDSAYPYQKVTLSQWCNLQEDHPPVCLTDTDGDGFKVMEDCNDSQASINPNQYDIPGNGIDEDCSGMDSQPKNLVLIFLESHRAVFSGFLEPFGATRAATPFLDQLAPKSHIWTDFTASGIPTISALLATHLSIWKHPTKYIATTFTQLNHQSFVNILRDKGYLTHFFSSADPAWDNQIPWIGKWYHNYSYSRQRERDWDMFQHMANWMKDSLRASRPFLMTAISKTNHYPFNTVKEMPKHPPEATLEDKMVATMTYTERSLQNFFTNIQNESWYKNTLFIILADHGFALGEHGSSGIGYGLYTENTWIPFLIFGSHPKLGPSKIHPEPASQIDIAPTILDLLGIAEPNHFMGHSLVRKNIQNPSAVVLRGFQALWATPDFRWHGPYGAEPRPQGNELFNPKLDRNERKNLWNQYPQFTDSISNQLSKLTPLHIYLIENNRIWNNPID